MFAPGSCEQHPTVDAEQVARNDAIFREANERIDRAGARLDARDPLPFICECADPECRALLSLTRGEYEEVRDHGKRFAVAPGHERSADGHAEVVERRDGYVVVQKVGAAAEVAEALDPRGD